MTGVLLAVLTAGCGANDAGATDQTLVPVEGGSVTVGIDAVPSQCNPNVAGTRDWASEVVLQDVLPSAFVTDSHGHSTGNEDLALQAELTNPAPQTIVYTLNPKAVWSDGVPITAADFRYAWLQQRGSGPPGAPPVSTSALGYRDIRSVTGSDHGKTVTVVFKRPFADWRMLFHDLLPAHVMKRVGWNPPCTTVSPAVDLSGGPFMISSVVPGRQVVLTDNPRWWGTAPLLSQIVVRIASGPAQLAAWLRTGLVQVVQPTSFDPAVLQRLASDPGANTHVDVSSTFLQLEFATTTSLTRQLAVRQAIAYGIDRQALVDKLVGWADSDIVPSQSHLYVQTQAPYPSAPSSSDAPNPFVAAHEPGTTTSTTTTTTTTGGSPPASGSMPWPTLNDPLQEANLMTEAGYARDASGRWVDAAGRPVTVRLVVDSADVWASAASSLIVHQLQQAGFTVALADAAGADAAGAVLASGSADVALLPLTAGPYPSRSLAWYTTALGPPGQNGSADWSDFDNARLTTLLMRASRLLNPVTAQPLYAQADQLLWANMVALPLFAEPTVASWSAQLAGLTPDPYGPSLLWSAPIWQLEVPGVASAPGS